MLISPAELAQIRLEVSPRLGDGISGLFRIVRGGEDLVPSGAGFKKGTPVTVATVPGRQNYVQNLTPREKQELGIVRADADYVATLEAFVDIRNSDLLVETGAAWSPGKTLLEGQKLAPSVPNGYLYLAVANGRTGTVEPVWPTTQGAEATDGTTRLRCLGKEPQFEVIMLIGPNTIGDFVSTRVATRRRQL